MRRVLLALTISLAFAQPALAKERKPKPKPVPIVDQTAAAANAASAAALRYLDVIARLDDAPGGPQLNAVIVTNPQAPLEAARLASTGRLKGRTVLVKDNVETREWPTTAGSLALKDNMTGRDAPLVADADAEAVTDR